MKNLLLIILCFSYFSNIFLGPYKDFFEYFDGLATMIENKSPDAKINLIIFRKACIEENIVYRPHLIAFKNIAIESNNGEVKNFIEFMLNHDINTGRPAQPPNI